LDLRRVYGEIALPATRFRAIARHLYPDAAILAVPLLVVRIVADRVRSFLVGGSEHYSLQNFVLIDVDSPAGFRRYFLHRFLADLYVGSKRHFFSGQTFAVLFTTMPSGD